MDDRININLQIEGYTIPLTIRRKDEARYRTAAKQVVDMVNAYRSRFHSSGLKVQTIGMENILVMVAFQFALHSVELEESNETGPILEKLDELSQELEKEFSKN